MNDTIRAVLESQAKYLRREIEMYHSEAERTSELLRQYQSEADKLQVQLTDIESVLSSKDALAA